MRLSAIVQAKKKFPKITRERSTGIKWVCCSEPFRERTQKGEQVWMSYCMWRKTDGSMGGMNRVVARPKIDPDSGVATLGPKPTKITLDGKDMPKCPR